MNVKINITRWDYLRMQLYFFPRSRGIWVFCFAIWAFFFTTSLNRLGFMGDVVCRACNVFASLISATIFVLIATLTLFSILIIFGLLTAGRIPGFLGEHKFALKDKGLFETTSVNEVLTKWVGMTHLAKTKSFIYVRAGYLWHILPKTSFENQQQFDEFWHALSSKWEANRR